MMADNPRVFQINVSRGGVPKTAVAAADVTHDGIVTDRQRDTRHHGGPERAVCLWRLETILALQREGHPVFPGSAGENLTLVGLPAEVLVPGARLRVGSDVILTLTTYVVPCRTIAESFLLGNSTRISQETHPGFARIYARVLTTGRISAGDPVVIAPSD